MKDDLASILVSVYNKEEFLPKCLESLRNQTYKNIEIIVQTRKAKSYRDEWMGWRHSKEANSSPLFKAICDKRIMISVATTLKKDKTLTVEQQLVNLCFDGTKF